MSGHGAGHGHHEHSHSDNPEHKRIGIFIAVIAVVMAIVSALTNQQSNELIVKEVKASNGFAWYQSKRQRSYVNDVELKRIDIELAGTVTDAQRKLLEAHKAKLIAKNAEYDAEGKDILKSAEADKTAAAVAAHKHHQYEYSEITLHIAVVLCSLVLLTDQKVFFRIGLVATAIGIVIGGVTYFGSGHHGEGEHKEEAKPAAAKSGDEGARAPAKPAGGDAHAPVPAPAKH